MWLAQGHEPIYRTINRFRVQPEVVKELIGKYQEMQEILDL